MARGSAAACSPFIRQAASGERQAAAAASGEGSMAIPQQVRGGRPSRAPSVQLRRSAVPAARAGRGAEQRLAYLSAITACPLMLACLPLPNLHPHPCFYEGSHSPTTSLRPATDACCARSGPPPPLVSLGPARLLPLSP